MEKKVIKISKEKLVDAIQESIDRVMNEGIDINYTNQTVSYNPSHEENVDTSLESNPSKDTSLVNCVNVWSIFKRKRGSRGDGNPFIYALKGEGGWKFRSDNDRRQVEQQFQKIAAKFAQMYPVGITILMPSGNSLNRYIADVVMSQTNNAELIEGAICKITTQEVENIVLKPNSRFRKIYGKDFEGAFKQLCNYLDLMDEERDGYFARHLVSDNRMRDTLDTTLKVSTDRFAEFANKINGQNVLIIDDTISRGQSIIEACKIIQESYAPKSITVLTLLSKLY